MIVTVFFVLTPKYPVRTDYNFLHRNIILQARFYTYDAIKDL